MKTIKRPSLPELRRLLESIGGRAFAVDFFLSHHISKRIRVEREKFHKVPLRHLRTIEARSRTMCDRLLRCERAERKAAKGVL